uniref:Uncharacterized protein n=1 Tax=Oryza glumipatula TaxID=40148 RepID=A0A0E0AW48_9ORYZ
MNCLTIHRRRVAPSPIPSKIPPIPAGIEDRSRPHHHPGGASIAYESSSSSSSHRGCKRDKGKRARDISTAAASVAASAARSSSTMSHFKSGSRVKCTMLAVLCGKVGKQRTPPGPVPESQRPRPSFPFPELISSGRLDVHTLINPTVDQFLEAQRALQPRFIYLQGQLLDNEEEIGALVWGDADVSDPQTFSSLICSPFPTIVYLEVPSGEKIAQSLQSKGISYIMYWRYSLSSYAASHFRHSLLSVVQSSCSHAWDAFQLAYASFEQYCVRNNDVQRLMLGPHLLGDAPRIYITPPGNKMTEEEDTSEYFPDIKIYDEDVHLKLLICGAHCTPFRWCKLQDRVSAAPPLHVDSALLDGVVTICCDITTSSSSHVSLLLSGSPQTCFDDELLEKHIKKELIESRRLVRVVSVSEDDGPSSAEPLTSMSVASGASTFEVLMTLPKWAAQVLKYLAQETSYKSLVPLGIASVNGTPVSSFDKEDVDRLLFFCTNQDEDGAIGSGLYHHLPRWSASLAKDRVKRNFVSKPGWTCGSRGGGRKMKSSRTSSARRRSIASVHQEDPSAASSSKTPTTNGRPRPLSQKPPCALAPHRVGRYSAARVLALHEDGRLVILLPVTNISSHSAASSPSPRTASPLPTCSPEEEVKETAGEKGILRRIRSRIALEVDAAEKPQKQQQQIIKAERLRICGVVCSTMPHFPSGSRVKCTMLAVLCGKVGKQRMPPDPLPESQRPRPSFPFQELISSGRLDVHTLINPTVDQFLEAQRALQPRFMYFQGQQLDKEEEIGRLVWGDADVSDPQIFSSLICPPFPTIVYLEVPSGEKIAQSLQSKDSSILNSLEDGLNALLNIEFRWCKLQDRVSAAPPLHCDSTLLDGVVTICCDITTSSSSHVSLLLSGSPQTCFDDKLLEKHIKKELIESRRLVRVVSVSEDDRPSSAEPLTSMSVASGASTFEVLMTLPKWAAQVLKYLAQETSYKSLVPLGIASVNGTPVSSFDRQDVDRLLFFCTNQDEDEAIANGLYHHPPRWSASLAKDRVKANMVNESSPRSSSPSSSSSSSSPRGEEEAQEGSSRSCGFRFRARLLFDPRTGSGDLSFMNDLLLLVVLQGSMVE